MTKGRRIEGNLKKKKNQALRHFMLPSVCEGLLEKLYRTRCKAAEEERALRFVNKEKKKSD